MELDGDLWCVTPVSQMGKGKVKGRRNMLSRLARAKAKLLVEETRIATELKPYRVELKGKITCSFLLILLSGQ